MSPLTIASHEQPRTMTSLPKRVLYASIGLAGLVIAATVIDILTGKIFSGEGRSWGMDVIFLICAGLVVYLAFDALAEQK